MRFEKLMFPVLAALLGLGGLAEACSSYGGDSDAALRTAAPTAGSGPQAPRESTTPSVPAGAAPSGNALCNLRGQQICEPDLEGTASGQSRCSAADVPDGGNFDDAGAEGDAAKPPLACRLTSQQGTVAPACTQAASNGRDGVACYTGDDCAPGYDCVLQGARAICRRYCCTSSCSEEAPDAQADAQAEAKADAAATSYCDSLPLLSAPLVAPVCLPVRACQLLKLGSCDVSETCAVLTDGLTSCVPIGPAPAGGSCDTDHCAPGLTCLGQTGNRKCYTLCRVGAKMGCAPGQVCQTSTVFRDNSYGVCEAG